MKSNKKLKIHIISTVNGQINEGMRNVATHIAKALEQNHKVYYSGLKNLLSIIIYSISCNVTMIFARANKQLYWMSRIVRMLCPHVWIVCVQKPEPSFIELVKKHPLKVNYFSIIDNDLDELIIQKGYRKELLNIGINTTKFIPVDKERQIELKKQYGININRPLVVHVGHCSSGRGLEEFAYISNAERMVVASGMFSNAETIQQLEESGVMIHTGYMEHIEDIYQMADVYLFPTHSTEFVISIPLSAMEALACGVPVIGYKDFDNLNIIQAEPDAIILISDKHELNEAVAQAAAKKKNESYLIHPKTWEEITEDILYFIEDI